MIKKILTAMLICLAFSVQASADNRNQIQIGIDDRCPVCAMKVAKYPKFACTMELHDGRRFAFCATGCLIRSWLHPEVFLKAEKADIQNVWVQDYFTGEKIDGLSAFWIGGSDVVGPMGPAFVPLKLERDIAVFQKRHGGEIIFRLNELNDEKWEAITGKKALNQ
jgi:nitrous oxide reductase accessory protein NosL